MFGWIQWDEILIPQKPLCSPSHLSIPLYKVFPWGHWTFHLLILYSTP